jgi:hypothetical protein
MFTIKIRKQKYTVEFAAKPLCDRVGVYGLFSPDKHRIFIHEDLRGEHYMDVLMHEIFHGFYREYHWRQKVSEEQCVTRMGEALARFYRDNPGFAKKLLLTKS